MIHNKLFKAATSVFLALVFLVLSIGQIFCPTSLFHKLKTRINGFELTVLTYHDVTTDRHKVSKYTISRNQLESDFRYLSSRDCTTLLPSEVYAMHTKKKHAPPKKPVMITFDDGYDSFYRYVYPLLKKYNLKASISIIGEQTEFFSVSFRKEGRRKHHLSWDELREMKTSGLVEVGNHTFDLHKNEKEKRHGVGKMIFENTDSYKRDIGKDVETLAAYMEQELNDRGVLFTYPYGDYNDDSNELLSRLGFKVLLNSDEHKNYVSYNDSSTLVLGRFNRSGEENTPHFFKQIKL